MDKRTLQGYAALRSNGRRDMPEMDGPRWGPKSGGVPKQLIVLCHGVGADGNDLIDLAPVWSQAVPDAAFVSPHAPEPYDMAPDIAPGGRQWFSLADRTPAIMEAGVRVAADALSRFVQAELNRLALPSGPFALVGFSQGAMTSLFTGLRRTPAPRAILAYSGALLGPATLAAELTARPPVLLVHGEADEVVPASRSREAEQVLGQTGVPIESLFCPRLGHGIDEAGLAAGALFLQKAFAEP
jgi:phospholipase/carboxylesterase